MNDDVNATPGALELAEEAGVDLANVEGTGAEGKVYKTDVEVYLAKDVGPAPQPKERASDQDIDFHTIVRVISKSNAMSPNAAAFPSVQVDAYVASFLRGGYELENTHYLGELPEGYMMMYVLVKK